MATTFERGQRLAGLPPAHIFTFYSPIFTDKFVKEDAIETVKRTFEEKLRECVNLVHVSSPLFMTRTSGFNDNLNGTERPLTFAPRDFPHVKLEVGFSLAKWKRWALHYYQLPVGRGIVTDFRGIRCDDDVDFSHSLYVDQFDWEKVITEEDRNVDYLKNTVKQVYKAVYDTEQVVSDKYGIAPILPEKLVFVSSDEMIKKYPQASPKERENLVCREHGAVFYMGIGGSMEDCTLRHDGRAPDYDDWISQRPDGGFGLNGDLLVWNPILEMSFELSSMGIRVNPKVMEQQLYLYNVPERKDLVWHRMLLDGTLPQSIGGGVGQSRLCQFMLRCAHIGEVQFGWYDPEEVAMMKDNDIGLLREDYQHAVKEANRRLRIYDTPLSSSDKVLVMQGWNKVLAFKTAFSEALSIYWRILVAANEQLDDWSETEDPIELVESNKDPLALCMMERLVDMEDLLVGLIDGAIRSRISPETQTVQREAYRSISDEATLQRARGDALQLECETVLDHLKLFARCGVHPHYWVLFCEAFAWTMKTHPPYAQDDDFEDLENQEASAYTRAVAQTVALPAVQVYNDLKGMAETDLYRVSVKALWETLSNDDRLSFGEKFYRTLLTKHPPLLDFFAETDMDLLSGHFVALINVLVSSVPNLGSPSSSFRTTLNHLGEMHRKMGIPTYSYALFGAQLIECLEPVFGSFEKETKAEGSPVTAKQLRGAFLTLYTETMSMVYYPMLRQERIVTAAREFYEQLKVEFQWTDDQLSRRLLGIEREVEATGQYTQTSEELEMGARLAWRNSAKCIGRISWNTLQVRDRRHINTPKKIFAEVEEHLKIATGGTNIQSVMTVFKPMTQKEPFGVRFWSSQLLRYAAYKDEETGEILGDPANLYLTEYLERCGYWTPPTPKTPFDVLPLVLKVPGRKKPYVYQLPKEYAHEVTLEHPSLPEITALGYRWGTVPAISNFKMNLGGIVYQNIPFNGWFVSTEVVRNLMERYDAGVEITKVMGIDTDTHPMWRQIASNELELAVQHSFQKNGYTIVDPHTVGRSFCTHVRREREQFGRECPGQWSWIGGLVGPTNPTWHLEMRDFLVLPQYEYASEGLLLHTSLDGADSTWDDDKSCSSITSASTCRSSVRITIPVVLIAYGSETGCAEAAARRLKRRLKLLKPLLVSLNEVPRLEVTEKRKISHVICICSTFGKGDAPANAKEFLEAKEFLQANNKANKEVKFAVLALGSTIYPDFCQAGINVDRKLSEAGLTRFLALTKADEAAGADNVIAGWLKLVENLLLPGSLKSELEDWLDFNSGELPANVFSWEDGTPESDNGHELPISGSSLCVSNIELISDEDNECRSTRKITFEVPPGSSYESGDHLSVQPINSDSMVKRFLTCFETELVGYARRAPSFSNKKESPDEAALEWQSNQPFKLECVDDDERQTSDVFFKTPTRLSWLVKTQLDLSISAKNAADLLQVLVRLLNEMLDSLGEAKGDALSHPLVEEFITVSSPLIDEYGSEKTDSLDSFIAAFPTVIDLFEHFKELFFQDFVWKNFRLANADPIVKLPEVLVVMPRLQPRHYSISSSNYSSPKEITITVGVLNTTTSKGIKIEGVCSHYLADLRAGIDRAKISVVKSLFRLPKNPNAPLLMVGAGTGLSPLMGFLEDCSRDRNNDPKGGDVHLFFGCRTEKEFIYKDVIAAYEKEGLLKLHLALSRSAICPKKYVQHRITGMGKTGADYLVQEDTHFYLCGDARMAHDCFEACVELLRKHQGMSRVKAVQQLRQMRMDGRWQTDVWGIIDDFEDAKKSIEKSRKAAAKIWLTHFREDD